MDMESQSSPRTPAAPNGTGGDKNIIVITPNNRKQKIKATKETCGIQILESVCRQHGLDSSKWELKYGNRFVELSNSMPFLALPENATLTLVELNPARKEAAICVLLQMENGYRLKNTFHPSASLWDTLCYWEGSGQINADLLRLIVTTDYGTIYPVCIYMRRTIIGEEELRRVTLKDLGLIRGSACIRFVRRARNQLLYQANARVPYRVQESYHSQPQSDLESMVSSDAEDSAGFIGQKRQPGSPLVDLETQLDGLQLAEDDDIYQNFIEKKGFKRALLNLKINDDEEDDHAAESQDTVEPTYQYAYVSAKKSEMGDNS